MAEPKILPKGIVVNAPEIEGNIGSIDSEPLDLADIAKFWKENYWWRIWGSRSRELNGATVARLFATISNGKSFVPLRGPANRDEDGSSLRTSHHDSGGSSVVGFPKNSSRPSTTSSSTASRAPVMPPPILKKSRGPSSVGPRPTARFISPHESEDEEDKLGNSNSHVVVQPPSPTVEQEAPSSKKERRPSANGNSRKQGFVVSSASKKKRPTIVRRKNSQSSNDSLTKTGDMKSGDLPSGAQQSSVGRTPPIRDQTQPNNLVLRSKFQENFSPSPEKSARKRKSPKLADGKRISHKSLAEKPKLQLGKAPITDDISGGDPGPSTSTLQALNNSGTVTYEDELNTEELEELEMQRILLAQANAKMQQKNSEATQPTLDRSRNVKTNQTKHAPNRSASEGNLSRGANLYLSRDIKSAARPAPTLAEVTGELGVGQDGSNEIRRGSPPYVGKGKGRDLEELRTTDMFAKIPVLPAPATIDTPSSLARSKSQLTMLLERDRVRSSEHKADKKKGKE